MLQNSPHRDLSISFSEREFQQIQEICAVNERDNASFVHEAVQHYIHCLKKIPAEASQAREEEGDNPFYLFTEWNSEADSAYDVLR